MHYNQGPWTRYHAHVSRNYDDWSNTFVAIVSNGGVEGDIKLGLYDPYGKQTGFARHECMSSSTSRRILTRRPMCTRERDEIIRSSLMTS